MAGGSAHACHALQSRSCCLLLTAARHGRGWPRGAALWWGQVPLCRGTWEHSRLVEGTGNSLSSLPPSHSHFCSECRGAGIRPFLGLGDSRLPSHPMALGAMILRTWLPAGHQAPTAVPLVSLCTGGLHASPAVTVLKGKDVGERRGNRCGPADLLARGLCRAGDLGLVLGSCLALAACLHGGESRSAVHSRQWGTGIPQAAVRAQTSLCSHKTWPVGSVKLLFGPAPVGDLALGNANSKLRAML